MAGIFAKYVTDKKAEEDGVWVENEELVNDDDTVTAFKIKRISISNTSYQAKINEPLRRLDALNKNPNNKNTAKDTVDIQRRLGEIYVDEILVDWRNVKKPAELDENGNFVTGDDGKVNCYDHNAIEDALKANTQHNSEHFIIDLNSKQYESIEIECNINIKEELKTDDAATIYYHNGKIYVSTYRTKGDLVSYDINCNRNQGKVDLDVGQMHVISHNCPSAIQGISIFERDGKTYVAFARSAKFSPSSIDVYELNDDETLGDFSGSTSFKHQGLEGIKVNDDGTVTGIYEYEGSNTLDKNIDDIIGNGEKNKHDSSYNAKANFWNKTIHGLNNSSYDEAIAREEMEKNPYANYYY